MELASDVIEFLRSAPEGAYVGIDEGGLCLEIVDDDEMTGQSFEIGGIPEEIEQA